MYRSWNERRGGRKEEVERVGMWPREGEGYLPRVYAARPRKSHRCMH